MDLHQVVMLLRELVLVGRQGLVEQRGPEAATAAEQIRSLLSDRFRLDLPASSLWEDFVNDPDESTAELIGALEAMIEADPSLAQELRELVLQYRRDTGSPQARMRTPAERVGSASGPVLDTEPEPPSEEGKGAYLYGNLAPGQVGLKADQDLSRKVPASDQALEQFRNRAGVMIKWPEDLLAIIESHPGVEPGIRMVLRTELRQVLDQLWQRERADEEQIETHLWSIRRMSPDVFDAIVSFLGGIKEGEALELSSIAHRVRERAAQ